MLPSLAPHVYPNLRISPTPPTPPPPSPPPTSAHSSSSSHISTSSSFSPNSPSYSHSPHNISPMQSIPPGSRLIVDLPIVTDTSASIPNHDSEILGHHHMITRSKAGIYKPKALALSSTILPEPKNIKQSLATPEWKQAMEVEL
ncbi:Speckle targeted PIP5K1A-regulated poly(A)polymerase [Striga asiatica]|uniref:Speckle targeted PIP5K1A-regulated poly(A)polymerase n=1 Tax=Striga asiatica TaxID=4170 RepID=A0A5A7PR23_STRAF|nr:Speckle targeted PIP5K1A-regulated poly(A)polymerase [Striga asiatica]